MERLRKYWDRGSVFINSITGTAESQFLMVVQVVQLMARVLMRLWKDNLGNILTEAQFILSGQEITAGIVPVELDGTGGASMSYGKTWKYRVHGSR